MAINIEDLKKLREETGAGIADVRSALEEAAGDVTKAKELIKQRGFDKAGGKSDREVKAGMIEVYSHAGRIGVVLQLQCETDFVAKTEDFKTLAHEVAMQIASMNPETPEELLAQEYIRDGSQTIEQLVKAAIAKLGENIQIGKFARIALGE